MSDMNTNIINTIKGLGLDMIQTAGSGHPGIVLGAAPILYTLYAKHMCVNTNDPSWINRDRFVLSAGHGSALLYAILYMAGNDVTMDDLRLFRQLGSRTPGHPELGVTAGVDMSTGPLGQGLASAVGIAMGETFLSNRYAIPRKNMFDHHGEIIDFNTYVLCGDGDLMEGVAYEAASLAGTQRLGKLIVLYDSNQVTLDGSTKTSFTENVMDRFKALGWHTDFVRDANDIGMIDKAISKAKGVFDKPSIIEIRSVIGQGSMKQGTSVVHGGGIDQAEVRSLKEAWGLPTDPFVTNEEYRVAFRKELTTRSRNKFNVWNDSYREFFNQKPWAGPEIAKLLSGKLDLELGADKFTDLVDFNILESMRDANQRVMNAYNKEVFNMIGGSADVSSSTKTYLSDFSIFSYEHREAKNISFGVREHAMGAIMNGLASLGLRPFGSTFLSFSDYMKPAIRMSALMNLPVTYIFTHDSISIGQDGPTHQPIEHLESLRLIPNLVVFRPADIKELIGCWALIYKNQYPTALVLARGDSAVLTRTSASKVEMGGYIVKDSEEEYLPGVIVATGTDVHVALEVSVRLEKMGIKVRVVSMPSRELFLKQSQEYQDFVLPDLTKVVIFETGATGGWFRFVYNEKYLITLDQFGKSGRGSELLAHYQMDVESVTTRIYELLK